MFFSDAGVAASLPWISRSRRSSWPAARSDAKQTRRPANVAAPLRAGSGLRVAGAYTAVLCTAHLDDVVWGVIQTNSGHLGSDGSKH